MELILEEIEKQAMRLPKEERGVLAEKLLQSLDDSSLSEVDEAWIQESEKRYNKYLSGKTSPIPGEKIFSEIRQELKWQK